MKSALNKQHKKKKKPVNINISFNINSKNISNNELVSNLDSCRVKPLLNFTNEAKIDQFKHFDKSIIEFTKEENVITNSKIETKKIVKVKKNSMDFSDLASQGMKNKKLSSSSEKLTQKKKHSVSYLQQFQAKTKNQSVERGKKKYNEKIKQHSLKNNNESPLDSVFYQYQMGRLTLTDMKSQIQQIMKRQQQKRKKEKRKKNSVKKMENQKRLPQICLQKMRKRSCKSQRGDLHTRRNSFHYSQNSINKNLSMNKIYDGKIINTSLALSNEQNDQIMQYYVKIQQSNNIRCVVKTSNSAKQIGKLLEEERKNHKIDIKNSKRTIQNIMASKIQTAWRQFQTKKIISHIIKKINKIDLQIELTDEHQIINFPQQKIPVQRQSSNRLMQHISSCLEEINSKQISMLNNKDKKEVQNYKQILRWDNIMQFIKLNLLNQEITKEQCLSRILQYLEIVKNNIQIKCKKSQNIEESSIHQMNSFTHIYQSKQVSNNIEQIELSSFNSEHQKIEIEQITFLTVERALKQRKKILSKEKDKEISRLQQMLESGKLNSITFLHQKQIAQKWYKNNFKQLKKITNNLYKGYKEAKNVIQKTNLQYGENDDKQKIQGMVKCLSQKYIKNHKIINQQCSKLDPNNRQILEKQQIEKTYKKQKNQTQIQDKEEYNRQIDIDYMQFSKQFDGISQNQIPVLVNNSQAEQISLFNNFINDKNKKLKYLCLEDKDDIFQFIFLDLCLQIVLETPKATNIIDSIQKLVNRQKNNLKLAKGLKTNLVSTKEYLEKIKTHILQNNRQVLGNLQVAMGPTVVEMLRYMHQFIDDEEIQNEQEVGSLIIPVAIFNQFQQSPKNVPKFQRIYQQQEREAYRMSLLKSLSHIHHKAIFDCLNQNLDQLRPYGIWGKPFPWKKFIQQKTKLSQSQRQKLFNSGIDKTIQCCSYVCGIMADKQQSLFGNHKVSEDYINQIRQDRLSKLLATDLLQNEERWMFYDDEQTQFHIQISNYLLLRLIKEACEDLQAFQL